MNEEDSKFKKFVLDARVQLAVSIHIIAICVAEIANQTSDTLIMCYLIFITSLKAIEHIFAIMSGE